MLHSCQRSLSFGLVRRKSGRGTTPSPHRVGDDHLWRSADGVASLRNDPLAATGAHGSDILAAVAGRRLAGHLVRDANRFESSCWYSPGLEEDCPHCRRSSTQHGLLFQRLIGVTLRRARCCRSFRRGSSCLLLPEVAQEQIKHLTNRSTLFSLGRFASC